MHWSMPLFNLTCFRYLLKRCMQRKQFVNTAHKQLKLRNQNMIFLLQLVKAADCQNDQSVQRGQSCNHIPPLYLLDLTTKPIVKVQTPYFLAAYPVYISNNE